MRTTRVMTVLFINLAALLAGQRSAGQTVVHRLEGDGFFLIQETGAMVVQKKDTLRVDMLPPAEARLQRYASVDLRVGDIILMLNGRKVTSAGQLDSLYKEIKAGEEVSIGIKREGALRLVKYTRADESKLPKRQMMMMRNEGPGSNNQVQVQTRDGMKSFSGEGVSILPGVGLVIGPKDDKIIVLAVLPTDGKNASGEVREGDIIVSVDGTKFGSTDKLVGYVEALAEGTRMELSLRRADTTLTVAFVKTPGKVRKVIKSN